MWLFFPTTHTATLWHRSRSMVLAGPRFEITGKTTASVLLAWLLLVPTPATGTFNGHKNKIYTVMAHAAVRRYNTCQVKSPLSTRLWSEMTVCRIWAALCRELKPNSKHVTERKQQQAPLRKDCKLLMYKQHQVTHIEVTVFRHKDGVHRTVSLLAVLVKSTCSSYCVLQRWMQVLVFPKRKFPGKLCGS